MKPTNHVSKSDGHEPLVTSAILEATIAEQKKRKKVYNPLASEPLLKSHLYDEMLKVCGRMGLAGVPSPILRGVRTDVEKLLQLTVAALQAANRELWQGFLPLEDGTDSKVPSDGADDGKAETLLRNSQEEETL